MTRQDCDVVRQDVQLFADAGEEQFLVASRQIPAPDSAGEKNVAADHQTVSARVKAEAARRMPWQIDYLKGQTSERAFRRLANDEIRGGWLDFQLEAERAEEVP